MSDTPATPHAVKVINPTSRPVDLESGRTLATGETDTVTIGPYLQSKLDARLLVIVDDAYGEDAVDSDEEQAAGDQAGDGSSDGPSTADASVDEKPEASGKNEHSAAAPRGRRTTRHAEEN